MHGSGHFKFSSSSFTTVHWIPLSSWGSFIGFYIWAVPFLPLRVSIYRIYLWYLSSLAWTLPAPIHTERSVSHVHSSLLCNEGPRKTILIKSSTAYWLRITSTHFQSEINFLQCKKTNMKVEPSLKAKLPSTLYNRLKSINLKPLQRHIMKNWGLPFNCWEGGASQSITR